MLFALSDLAAIDDTGKHLTVHTRHVKAAINTITDLGKPVGTLSEATQVSQSHEARGYMLMRHLIKQYPVSKHRYIRKAELSRLMSARGHMEPARAKYIEDLVKGTKEVTVFQTEARGIAYGWVGSLEEEGK